jgi:hypothetical protein
LRASTSQHLPNHHVAKDEHAESQEPSKVEAWLSDMQTTASQGNETFCHSLLTVSATKPTPRAAIVSAVASIANTMPLHHHQHKVPLRTDKTPPLPEPSIQSHGSSLMSPLRRIRPFPSSICSSSISTSRNHTARLSTMTMQLLFPFGKIKFPKSLFLYPPKTLVISPHSDICSTRS